MNKLYGATIGYFYIEEVIMLQMFIEFDIDDFLHESFKTELELLKKKYEIQEDKKPLVKKIATTAGKYRHSIGDLVLDDLLELAEHDLVFVEFYLWSKANMHVDSINKAQSLYKDLEYDGYIVVDDEYLLCYKHSDLDGFYEEKLDDLLDDVDFVEECFTANELARMWVEEKSKASVSRRLMSNEEELLDLLDMDLTEATDLSNGQMLMYSLLY